MDNIVEYDSAVDTIVEDNGVVNNLVEDDSVVEYDGVVDNIATRFLPPVQIS